MLETFEISEILEICEILEISEILKIFLSEYFISSSCGTLCICKCLGVAGAASEAGEDYYNDYGHKGKDWDKGWKGTTWGKTWKTWDTTWAPKTTKWTTKWTTTPKRCFWGPWGVWSHPTVTCGSTTVTKRRFCRCSDGSQPKRGTCGMKDKDTKVQHLGPCRMPTTPHPKPYVEGKRRKRF